MVFGVKQGEVELRRVRVKILLIIWFSGTCAPRSGTGALRRSDGKQSNSCLVGARRAGIYGALRRPFKSYQGFSLALARRAG
ncbi:hypothetical protein A2U01_0062863 [Trifolium medium]|uniref:Uncharacterized protein n=1 Tax=Trifolium medium TaxID=97028 RepID=A0A392S0U5_9FABA|nr:hypothetical protein [Trifolium medium]